MKKILALMLVVCMFLMSGCMLVDMSVTIQPDGSGQAMTMVGFSESGMKMLIAMTSESGTEEEIDAVFKEAIQDMKAFERNGVTYYGDVADNSELVTEFSSLRELNQIFQTSPTTSSAGFEAEKSSIKRNEDGSVALKIDVPTGYQTIIEASAAEKGEDVNMEEVAAIMSEMVIAYSYKFPKAVKQVSGPDAGVVIDGNSLFVDMVAVMKEVDKFGPQTLEFVTEPNAVAPTKLLFSDVTEDKWYYDAVVTMAEEGVVNGMGDGTFGPESTMTYAQFCQVLAKYMGAETGEKNGYWAGKAIDYCVAKEWILSRGEITPANYDVPITREAAISAMFLSMYGYDDVDYIEYMAEESYNIPDGDTIDEVYKNNVYGAYYWGITSGVDEAGTFMPKKELTRAEVCQLFYNIWN